MKILLKFSRKFREKFRKLWKCGFVGVSGTEPSEASQNIKKINRKINGNLQNFENFHEFLANYDLKNLF